MMVTARKQLHPVVLPDGVLAECARRYRAGDTLRQVSEYAEVSHETLRKLLQAGGTATNRGPRQTCKRGHPWTAQNVYTNRIGQSSCRICAKLSKARQKGATRSEIKAMLVMLPEPKPAKEAVRVPWWEYRLNEWEADLRAERQLAAVVREFVRCRNHWPTVILAAAENVCVIGGEIRVRESNGRTEPEPGVGEFFAR